MCADSTKPDFAALVVEHQRGVWRYLRFLGCDPSLADDLTQETFVAAYRAGVKDLGHQALAAYFRVVARRLFARSLKVRRRLVLEEIERADEVWAEFNDDDGGDGRIEALRRCLEKLEERERRIVNLRYGEQASRQSLADKTGLSDDGAKNLLQRTKAKLRECIERRLSHD